jgi:hypothetical protein
MLHNNLQHLVIRMHSVRGQTSLERSAYSMPPHMNESFSKGATFTRRCHTQSYGKVFLHRDKNAQHIGFFDVSLQHHLGSPLGGWIQRSQPITVSNVKKKLRNKRKVESNNIPFTKIPSHHFRPCATMLPLGPPSNCCEWSCCQQQQV